MNLIVMTMMIQARMMNILIRNDKRKNKDDIVNDLNIINKWQVLFISKIINNQKVTLSAFIYKYFS